MWPSDFELDQKILLALEGGPKTVVAIRLFLHEREKVWVSDYQIAASISALVAAGRCDAVEIDSRPCVGYAMLYSLAQTK